MSITIYHNPRCSKSRQTLALLEAGGVRPIVRLYMTDHMTRAELDKLISQLGFDSAVQLMRKGEAVYKEMNLKSESNEAALRDAMLAHPKLIERPIVTDGKRTVLGRPPEAASIFLK